MSIEREKVNSFSDYRKEFLQSVELLRWIWKGMIPKESKGFAYLMIVVHVISTILMTLSPLLVAYMINFLIKGASDGVFDLSERKIVWLLLIGYGILELSHRGSDFVRRVFREKQFMPNMKSIDRFITRMIYEKSIGQHIREMRHLSIESIQKGRNNVLQMQFIMLFDVSHALLTLTVSFSALWFISIMAGAVFTVFLIPYFMWSIYLNAKIAKTAYPIDHDFRSLFRYRVARWKHFIRVHVAGMEEEEITTMDDAFDEIAGRETACWLNVIRHSFFRDTLIVVGMIIVLGFSLNSVMAGVFSVGMLYPLIAWMKSASHNLLWFNDIEHQINKCMPAVKALKKASDLPPEITDKKNAIKILDEPIGIRFDNVSFSHQPSALYPPKNGDKEEYGLILRDVSFEIKPGETIGCVGSSGAGKSTLTMLLLRAYDPCSGRILINGHDLRDIKLSSWLKIMGYVPQSPELLDGSLGMNIMYGHHNGSVDDRLLRETAGALCIDFSNRDRQGLETIIGPDGVQISGGEKQRATVANQIIGRPRVFLADEATSALDSTSEQVIQKGLDSHISGATSLIVAHRISTLKNCDSILVLRPLGEVGEGENQIEAIGRFEELKSISPTFKRLATDQGL